MSNFMNTIRTIWKKMNKKAYRDAFVSGQISNTISAQIALLREERGWTQKQLADKAGMKQPRISALEDPNWENCEVETLKRLASALDVGLTVRFEPFSEVVSWASNVTDEKLVVANFANDHLVDASGLVPRQEPASNPSKPCPYEQAIATLQLHKLGPGSVTVQYLVQ